MHRGRGLCSFLPGQPASPLLLARRRNLLAELLGRFWQPAAGAAEGCAARGARPDPGLGSRNAPLKRLGHRPQAVGLSGLIREAGALFAPLPAALAGTEEGSLGPHPERGTSEPRMEGRGVLRAVALQTG